MIGFPAATQSVVDAFNAAALAHGLTAYLNEPAGIVGASVQLGLSRGRT